MARKRSSAHSATPSSWLFNAPADLLIGAGAWTLPLVALTWWVSRNTSVDVAFAFTVLTLVCNHPHYMATIHRAYLDRDALLHHRRYTVHATMLLVLLLVAAHGVPALRPPLVSAYLYWSPWHYTAQSFGLALLFARRRGTAVTAEQRHWLFAAFVASYGVWLLAAQSRPSDDPYVLSLSLDPVWANGLAAALATFVLGACAGVVMRRPRTASHAAYVPTLLLCTTQIAWFVAPWFVGLLGGPTAPNLYFTSGVLAFMHCAQYLWVTTYYTRAAQMGTRAWSAWRYASILVLGGVALFIPGPWIASSVVGLDLRESLILFTAVVNLHHFMLDGALWKLRDARVASVLVEGRCEPAAAVAAPRAVHPALQWGLAVALLLIAGADLSQRWLTRDTASSHSISLAHALNGHDTRVDIRRAALLARAARPDAAIELLRPIVADNPLHAPAQRLLGSLLLAGNRWPEAEDLYQQVALRGGLDAAEYINLGVISVRANDMQAAESAFRQALTLDPAAADAHLNLAEALWRQQRRNEAIGSYQQYLRLAEPRDARQQRVYLLAALKLADALAEQGATAEALTLLERSARAAEQIAASDLATAAHARAGHLRQR